jgi:4-aminobutyrate aminotransferase / (S)-3-amino-2-methylpropionate transaminase / 5-aminovalerate transaminase
MAKRRTPAAAPESNPISTARPPAQPAGSITPVPAGDANGAGAGPAAGVGAAGAGVAAPSAPRPPALYGRYSLEPVEVPRVETKFRRIATALPVPESVPVLEKLLALEPLSMASQPPILWDHASGFSVFDRFGNRWMDWGSCVLVANVGHAHPRVVNEVRRLVDRGQLATYVFPHEERALLVERLIKISPHGLDKVFLLTTGSEAVENMIKLMRTWGLRQSPSKKVIVSFAGGFHGRTLGAQLAGGIPALKAWIGGDDPSFVQVPFPDGYHQEDRSFRVFEESLAARGVGGQDVAGVLSESYLGIGPDFFPPEYVQELRKWCDGHRALLAFDEVQSGFGRTGRLFAFEHYKVTPDLFACGKGITSSLPLAAVIGRGEILSTYGPGAMTSTHSGSPLAVAAALASIDVLIEEGLVSRAASLEPLLADGLAKLAAKYPQVGWTGVKGMVGGIRIVRPGTREPDADLALRLNQAAFRKGLLMFAPVGLGGGCLKIAPPLSTPREALEEGMAVLGETFQEVIPG